MTMMNMGIKPTLSETCVPYMMRLSTSRPSRRCPASSPPCRPRPRRAAGRAAIAAIGAGAALELGRVRREDRRGNRDAGTKDDDDEAATAILLRNRRRNASLQRLRDGP